MTQTSNYQLSLWSEEDRILMESFNSDNQKIDAALKANADAVTELEEGKADAADMPRIITGSYTGTGTWGTIHYTVGARPKFLFLAAMSSAGGNYWAGILAFEGCCLRLRGEGHSNGIPTEQGTSFLFFTDDGFSLTHSSADVDDGYNREGVLYRYFAIC